MTELDARLKPLEDLVYFTIQRQLNSFVQQLANLNNQANQGGSGGGGNTGGGGSILWCYPSSSIAAGSPPSTVGGPLTGQTLYTISSSGFTALSGTYTIVNPRSAATAASKLTPVTPNTDNTYSVIDWDC